MRKLLGSIFLTTGCVLLFTSAEAVPVANLPLTCSTASAIGQPQDNCGGDWSYETPTAELIVLKGPSATATWIRASNLTSSDTVNVCTLPVEPGTYSNCRDAAGVRRYAFVPKSQVFPDSSPPPASGGARILDLSTLPVEITEPGVYVLNRSWDVATPLPPGVAIVITADNVTLDFQGFELLADVPSAAIRSSGGNVTIRNGGVRAGAGTTIEASGAGTRIEGIRASIARGSAIQLGGVGSILTDSVVSVGTDATAVSAGDDTIVRNNSLGSQFTAVRAASRALVADNDVQCGVDSPCIVVEGSATIVSGNELSERHGVGANGLVIHGDFNHALDNVLSPRSCSIGQFNRAAVTVDGRGNTIRGNLVPSCGGVPGWPTGIAFLRDGNFYGDNIVWATTPFAVGATVQTDLGGNVGFAQ